MTFKSNNAPKVRNTSRTATQQTRINRTTRHNAADSVQRKAYAKFVSASGAILILGGRKRQTMELLISGRENGIGVRRGGSKDRQWNVADNMRLLAEEGVSIGKHRMFFSDGHTLRGKGGVCDYFLLENWRRGSELHATKVVAESAPVISGNFPVPAEQLTPFLASGSIMSERDIELLNPTKRLSAHWQHAKMGGIV